MVLKDTESAKEINRWLRVCCILHNFLLTLGERWQPAIEDEDETLVRPEEFREVRPGDAQNAHFSRRSALFDAFKVWKAGQ